MGQESRQILTESSASRSLTRLHSRSHWDRLYFQGYSVAIEGFGSLRAVRLRGSVPNLLLAGGHSQVFVTWTSATQQFASSKPARERVA